MARARKTQTVDPRAEFEEVKAYYRRVLMAPIDDMAYEYPPVHIGPTWDREGDRWRLPERSLGWEFLAWTGVYLEESATEPWVWSPEQARFVLWWYAVDEHGKFIFTSGVLQRLKGWGKDPLGAALGLFEAIGPCIFSHFDEDGQPVGMPHPAPLVHIAAVSFEQTKNTMKVFNTFMSKRLITEYHLQVGKSQVTSGFRSIEAVTSSASTLQGARPTFTLMNETHEWMQNNDGHRLALTLANNAAKSKGGLSRTLRITNAPQPGLDSVAERERDAYEQAAAGKTRDFGMMYDSLEAHPDAPLDADAIPEVLRSVRGDSTWLDIDRLTAQVLNPNNPPSQARRFWYNQVVAAEDAWVTPQEVDSAFVKGEGMSLEDGDQVVLFGDGSKSDDASALVAVRLSDGVGELLHVDQPNKGEIVSRPAFDNAVAKAFERFTVVGFWFDPSHAKDKHAAGEDDSFWRPLCDDWMARYGRRLKLWAVTNGHQRHAIVFDMARSSNMEVFVDAAMRTREDLESGTIALVGSKVLATHMKNARILPTRFGASVRKDGRDSKRKIDAAVCLIGARAMWRKQQLGSIGTNKGTPGRRRVIVMT